MPDSMLVNPEQDLWVVEGPTVDFYGFPYPTRMVVLRLEADRLWVWSPIALTPELRAAVDDLGAVAWLVSPNKLHHLYLGEWLQAYPEAELWGPPSVVRKRNDLTFTGTLREQPPAAWAGALDQVWFHYSLVLEEEIFFHRASRTAILADLSENFSDAFLREHWAPWKRRIARLWKIVEPWGYAPLEIRATTLRRRAARAAVERMLAWDPERVIMAHGEWIEGDGRGYLEKAFGWLL
ncbi:MAG TPA: DUF4336 domain-containing protein [Gammaproteobacteria bacterium]|nr:DUF4336 domain-containing protein [Gammaproteobacteria bacterium]